MLPRFPKLLPYLSLLLLGGVFLGPLVTYATLTLDSTSLTSDGALTVKSASSSATTFGHADQSGTITIASTTQALTLDIGKSTSALTLSLASGTGGHTVNIATGTSTAKTINIGTGAQTINTITIGNASSSIALSGTLRITEGNQGSGKILTSDASGDATWQTPSSTVVARKVTATEATSTTNTTLLSFDIPANTLGTNKTLRLVAYGDMLNDSGAEDYVTLGVFFGGTEIWRDAVTMGTSTVRSVWHMQVYITNLSATNSQITNGFIVVDPRKSVATLGLGDIAQIGTPTSAGTSAAAALGSNDTTSIDTTALQALVLKTFWDSNNANHSWRLRAAYVVVE